jgi:hypothetical protein
MGFFKPIECPCRVNSQYVVFINASRGIVNAYLLVHALKAGLLLLVHALEPG